ncbi:hypothetical protein GCM10025868_20620 [Angustibacter aerolatus]|uniref:Uncharacterized protein n=1 Tax=Angustibacter aerolatus TaxID=1162965 RepID=A0ABQ6JGB1_9ACTN|nr:hypothetical protein GCM10025868_20620 [Angustibacter aerolatus]
MLAPVSALIGFTVMLPQSLVPGGLPDVVGLLDLEAGVTEQAGHLVQPRRRRARGFADDQPAPRPVHDEARLGGARAEVHHAADDLRRRQGHGDRAVRVDRPQPQAVRRATEPGREPPRHAVHRRQHHRARPDQRCQARRQRGQRLRLHRDHHDVVHPEALRPRPPR